LNYISPEAVFYIFVQDNDTNRFELGSDTISTPDVPSFVINFDLGTARGAFEIDTTCIPAHNHLEWLEADSDMNFFVPAFEKATIEIGGPFWNSDSISGHISSDLILRRNVHVVGDLIVDPGITLTLLRGAKLKIASFSDSESGGADTSSVEIIVHGTLAIDDAQGQRPSIAADTNLAGAWHGIRVQSSGRFETGIGAIIGDADVGLLIEKTTQPDTLSGLTITNCASAGIHTRSDLVTLANDSIVGVWPGKGIYVDSASPTITNCLIDSCEYGLYTFLSSSTIRNSRIDGPGVHGIYVAAGSLYADVDTLRFTKDTVYGYFSTAQMSVGSISQCRVDSCGFISDLEGQRSPYGIKAAFGGAVRLRNTTIRDFTTTGFDSFRSGSHLGRNKFENGGIGDDGNNAIYADSTGCSGCALRRGAHVGVGLDSLRADGNWWGESPPLASWFSGKVDRTPHLTTPLGKMAPPGIDAPLVGTIPRAHSIAQNYPNPFNSSTEIEFSLASHERVRVQIYNVLGQVVKMLADRDFVEGTHRVTWDGSNEDGQPVASGVYLYRITAGALVQSKKMVLLK
jgi:hypothetical protein